MVLALNSAIELHDSSVDAISHSMDSIDVELSCVLHMSAGNPAQDAGLAAVQGAMFSFKNGSIDGLVGDLDAEILKGELRIGTILHSNMIDLPCHISDQAVCLTLFLYPDYRKLSISGTGLKVTLLGEPEHVTECQLGRLNG